MLNDYLGNWVCSSFGRPLCSSMHSLEPFISRPALHLSTYWYKICFWLIPAANNVLYDIHRMSRVRRSYWQANTLQVLSTSKWKIPLAPHFCCVLCLRNFWHSCEIIGWRWAGGNLPSFNDTIVRNTHNSKDRRICLLCQKTLDLWYHCSANSPFEMVELIMFHYNSIYLNIMLECGTRRSCKILLQEYSIFPELSIERQCLNQFRLVKLTRLTNESSRN